MGINLRAGRGAPRRLGVDAVVERHRQADAPHVLVGAGVRQLVAVAQDRLDLRLGPVAVGGHARVGRRATVKTAEGIQNVGSNNEGLSSTYSN